MHVSDRLLRSAVESMPHGVCLIDGQGRVLLCNRAFQALFGLVADVAKPGLALDELVTEAAERGCPLPPLLTEYCRRETGATDPRTVTADLPDGRMISLHCHRLDDGTVFAQFEDVSEHHGREQDLRLQIEQRDQALDTMTYGLTVFGPDERLIIRNRRYLEMFDVESHVARPGVRYRDILADSVRRGAHPDMTLDDLYGLRIANVRRRELVTSELTLADGRIIQTTCRPIEDGGWLADHQDITEQRRIERKLREQNMLLDATLESMAHGLCVLDADLRIVARNKQFLDLYGFPEDVIVAGTTLYELAQCNVALGNYPDLSADQLYAEIKSHLVSDVKGNLALRRVRGRTVEVRHYPMENGGWVITYEDVTERLQTADAMREQIFRFDAALENMAQGLAMFDENLDLVVCNRRYIELFGLDPAVVRPGASLRTIISNRVDREASGGDAEALYREHASYLVHDDGSTLRRSLANGRIIEIRNEKMANGGWVATCEDITDRVKAARALEEQNERFDAALENMAQGLAMYDADFNLVVCNRRFLQLFGHDPSVVRPGVSLRTIIRHHSERGAFQGRDPDAVYDEHVSRLRAGRDAVIIRRVASGRTIEIRNERMVNGGWLATFEDVTERIQAARALEEQNRRFDAALENMVQGLAMLDSDQRLVVCNRRYLEIMGLSADFIRPGVTLYEMIEHTVALGRHGDKSAEALYAETNQMLNGRGPSGLVRRLSDGRVVAICHQPLAEGGWVITYEDITERERAAEIMRAQNQLFDAALENMAQGLAMFDDALNLVVCNRRYLEFFGLQPNAIRPGVTLFDMVRLANEAGCHGDSAPEHVYAGLAARIATGKKSALVRRLADGTVLAIRLQPRDTGGWVVTYEDITERERASDLLREQNLRFDAALENMAQGLAMFDEHLRLIVTNRRFLDMFGLAADAVPAGTGLRELIEISVAHGNYTDVHADDLYRDFVRDLHREVSLLDRHLADGRTLQATRRRMVHGGWVTTYEDITERRKAEQRIAHMARHDALTDLPNRVLFREKMDEGLTQVHLHGGIMAVFCLDLDNFKGVNDTLGHPIGDKLLTTVAERLVRAVGEHDTIARLGGDEFAILQAAEAAGEVEALARRIVEVVSEPMVIDGHEINSAASIGIAIAPCDGTEADLLMKSADLALYRAKADGRGVYRFFAPEMDARIQTRRKLELDLRKALAHDEFRLEYQPLVSTADRRVVGMEALLRWHHPERGPVPPAEFVPLAEDTRLIVPIGEWVLRHACAEATRWPRDVRLAVNLSPVQLKSRGFMSTVLSALSNSGLSPERLELEITEAVLLQDDAPTLDLLHQLRGLGVHICMDDFGTGYSSLSYLRRFPFDKIKIDRSFVAHLAESADGVAIVRAVAGLGASLGIATTAEGIETEAQFALVREHGCTEAQGYYFSRPQPASALPELFARLNRSADAA